VTLNLHFSQKDASQLGTKSTWGFRFGFVPPAARRLFCVVAMVQKTAGEPPALRRADVSHWQLSSYFTRVRNEVVAYLPQRSQPLAMRIAKHGRGKHPVEELRKKIGKMWDAGATQLEIADALQVPSADVRYHLQKSGVPANLQHKAHAVAHGKRVCVQCRENKELTRYPSPRHAICLACLNKNSQDKS